MNAKKRSLSSIVVAALVGLLLAGLWTWASSQIYGYFAINRFADHWPAFVKTVTPGLLLVVAVVSPTLLMISRLWKRAARWIIWSSITLYCFTEAITYLSFSMDSTGWATLGMTSGLIIVVGYLVQPRDAGSQSL